MKKAFEIAGGVGTVIVVGLLGGNDYPDKKTDVIANHHGQPHTPERTPGTENSSGVSPNGGYAVTASGNTINVTHSQNNRRVILNSDNPSPFSMIEESNIRIANEFSPSPFHISQHHSVVSQQNRSLNSQKVRQFNNKFIKYGNSYRGR